jgi:hypothetical protein
MKFKEDRPFASVDAAVMRLLEIANGMEADHLGRIDVGVLNIQFLQGGGSVEEYAAVNAATARAISPCIRPAATSASRRRAPISSPNGVCGYWTLSACSTPNFTG